MSCRAKSTCKPLAYLLAIFLACLVGCGDTGQNPEGNGSRPTAPPAHQAEVAVVGTLHLLADMPVGYTPGDLRALLTKLHPDVLAVEVPTNVPDPWRFAPPDLTLVTKPWAEKYHVPLVPIGWFEPIYETQFAQMIASFDTRGKTAAYEQLEREFQYQSTKRPLSCRFLNSESYRQLWRAYHFALHKLNGGNTPWETWNLQIYNNVLDVCRQHPGKRVVVVIGAPHAFFLVDSLRQSDEVQLVFTEEQFPLSSDEIAAQTSATDYLRALRMLDFDTLPAKELPRLSGLLDKIADVPAVRGDYHLFKGKLLLHRGEFDAARQQFELVARLDPQVVSVLDTSQDVAQPVGSHPLRETGLIYGAIARQRSGDKASAKAELQAILDTPSITDGTKKWAARVLADVDK